MSQVSMQFSTEDRDVQRALRNMVKETVKLREQNQELRRVNRQVSGEAKAQLREQQQLGERARKVLESMKTPAQRYREEIKDLQAQLKGGHLTQQQYNQAVEQAAAKHRKLKAELDGTAQAQRDLASAAERAMREAETPLDTYNRRVGELRQLLKAGVIDQKVFNANLEKQKQILQSAGKESSKAVLNVKKFVGAAVGIGSVAAGIRVASNALREEFNQYVRRLERAQTARMGAAEAIRSTKDNFMPDETLGRDQLEQTILDLSEETRTKVPIVAAALSDALSANSLTNDVAVNAVRNALKVKPGNLEAAATLSARALDIAAATGNTDIKGIIGFLQELQNTARTTSLGQLGKAGISAIASLARSGDSAEQAAELFATVSQLTTDDKGNTSSTGLKKFAVDLANFDIETKAERFERRSKELEDQLDRGIITESSYNRQLAREELRIHNNEGIAQGPADAYRAATSTTERIRVLQENENLRNEFLGSTSFDSNTEAALKAILAGDAVAMNELGRARQRISGIAAGRAVYDRQLGYLESGFLQESLTARQQLEVRSENLLLRDTGRGRLADIRSIVQEALEQTNQSGLDSITDLSRMWAFDGAVAFGTDPAQAAQRILRKAEDSTAGLEIQLLRDAVEQIKELVQLQKDNDRRKEAAASAAAAAVRHEEGAP